MSKRKKPSMETKLASALLALGHIPYDDAKRMSATQIISLYQFDHGILHGVEVNNQFWNFTPRLIRPHREKSKKDAGIVAKVKRLEKAQLTLKVAALDRICAQERKRTGSIRSRPAWPKGRKISSRGFSNSART